MTATAATHALARSGGECIKIGLRVKLLPDPEIHMSNTITVCVLGGTPYPEDEKYWICHPCRNIGMAIPIAVLESSKFNLLLGSRLA